MRGVARRVSKLVDVTDIAERAAKPTEGTKPDVTDRLRGINNLKNMLAALEERITLAREQGEARLVPVMERPRGAGSRRRLERLHALPAVRRQGLPPC